MDAEPAKDPLIKLDEIIADIAGLHAQMLEIWSRALIEHQAVDARFAPVLNPLYKLTWDKYLEARSISTAHRTQLLPRDKKSSARTFGTVGWRASAQLITHVELPELVRRIKALGPTVSRKLLRHVVSWDLRVGNIKAEENAELVASIEGLEVLLADLFFVAPRNGIRMSDANPWWPTLEGITTMEAHKTFFPDQDT